LGAAVDQFRLGDRFVSCSRGTVVDPDQNITALTPTEVKLLQCLAEHKGESVCDADLLHEVWEFSAHTNTRTLSTTVYRLRRKLEPSPTEPRYLRRTFDGYALLIDREVVDPWVSEGLREPPTAFFGRQEELEALVQLDDRFVSLVGPGGVGKTRLAARVGSILAARLPGGVVVVPLAGLDESAIRPTFESALGVMDGSMDAVERVLRERGRCLLLVDDCERMVEAVSEFVTWLADRAPEARFLFTSRVRLGLPGERLFGVPPLQPDAAVALLADRADRLSPGWGEAHPLAVRSIVASLDGLPLAIELAASRARILTADDLNARLDTRFQLLRATGDDGRHADLGSVIEDSWEILAPPSRAALSALAVCVGSFDTDIAEAVMADDSPGSWTLDVLQDLVDHSLVQTHASATARFHLLESVRLWCRERWAIGDGARFLDRLSSHVSSRCERMLCANPYGVADALRESRVHIEWGASWSQAGEEARGWCASALGWIAREYGGGREAISLIDRAMADGLSGMLRAHLRFARLRVGRDVTVSALERQEAVAAARACGCPRLPLMVQGEILGLEPLLPDVAAASSLVAKARQLGDAGVLAHCLRVEATRRLATGEFEMGTAGLEEAYPLAQAAGLKLLSLMIQINLGVCWTLSGTAEVAVPYLEAVSERASAIDAPYVQALALFHLGGTHYMLGDCEAAWMAAVQSRRCLVRVDAPLVLGQAYLEEGHALVDLDRLDEALSAYASARRLFEDAPQHWGNEVWRLFVVMCRVQLGDVAGGVAVLDGMPDHDNPIVRSNVPGAHGVLAAAQGDLRGAADFFDPAKVSADEPSQRFWWITFSLLRVAVLSRLGDEEAAMAFLALAEVRYAQLNHRLGTDACRIVRRRLEGTPLKGDAIESGYSRRAMQILDGRVA